MTVSLDQGYAHDHDSSNQWTDHRNEFHHSASDTQYQGIGHAHGPHEGAVGHHRESGEGQLSADELGQHLVQVLQDALNEFALRARSGEGQYNFAELAAVVKKKAAKNREPVSITMPVWPLRQP